MRKILNGFLAAGLLLLVACGGGDTEVKLGDTFQIKDADFSVKEVTAANILVNEAKKSTEIAPEGKAFVRVRSLTNGVDHILKAYVGEAEIEPMDYSAVMDFVSEDAGIEANYSEEFFLLAEGQKIDRIEVRGFNSSSKFILKDLQPTQVDGPALNPKMRAFMKEFEGGARILDAVKNYTSKDVYEVVTERGMDVPANPSLKNFDVYYMSPDGNTFKAFADGLGMVRIELTWAGDEIENLSFSM